MQRGPLRGRYFPIVLLLLAFVLAGCFNSQSGHGDISVTSDPSGAKVFLNDKDTGQTTPTVLKNVRVGTHKVTVKADGYKSTSESVVVKRSKSSSLSFKLTALPVDPDPDPPVDPDAAVIYGIVSENRGGRNVPGVTVTAFEAGTEIAVESTTSDEGGAYTLYVPAGTYDIVTDMAGQAQAKRQSLTVDIGGRATANLMAKKLRDPAGGPVVAPTISVLVEDPDAAGALVPFEPGAVVDWTDVTDGVVKVHSDNDMFRIKMWIGHQDDLPDFEVGILNDEMNFFLGDAIPGFGFIFDAPGETELIVAAYDYQDNWTEVRIPFTYEVGEPTGEVGPIAWVDLIAFTYGHDLGLYRKERAETFGVLDINDDPDMYDLGDGTYIDLSRIDKDVTMYTVVRWSETFYEQDDVQYFAEGYEIERSFNRNGPWEQIARLGYFFGQPYIDTSPRLAPGKPVYYRVRGLGPNAEKGPWSAPLSVTPLDRFEISLVDPADDATNVSLNPTLRWEHTDIGADEYVFDGFVAGVTGDPDGESGYYSWYFEDLQDVTEIDYNFDGTGVDLKPAHTYQWNIVEGRAYAYYRDNSMAVAFPWTGPAANDGYSGAANGEFIFTTTHEQ